MSANLDKSLDEIIGANKKPVRARINKRTQGPSRASKQLRRPTPGGNRNVRAPVAGAASRVARLLDSSREAKVNVEGLPRDIKQDAVKVCDYTLLVWIRVV